MKIFVVLFLAFFTKIGFCDVDSVLNQLLVCPSNSKLTFFDVVKDKESAKKDLIKSLGSLERENQTMTVQMVAFNPENSDGQVAEELNHLFRHNTVEYTAFLSKYSSDITEYAESHDGCRIDPKKFFISSVEAHEKEAREILENNLEVNEGESVPGRTQVIIDSSKKGLAKLQDRLLTSLEAFDFQVGEKISVDHVSGLASTLAKSQVIDPCSKNPTHNSANEIDKGVKKKEDQAADIKLYLSRLEENECGVSEFYINHIETYTIDDTLSYLEANSVKAKCKVPMIMIQLLSRDDMSVKNADAKFNRWLAARKKVK